MHADGSADPATRSTPIIKPPLWLLAELTYACPLQCAYCSNPVDFAGHGKTMDTETWIRVLRDARAMGALQLGLGLAAVRAGAALARRLAPPAPEGGAER